MADSAQECEDASLAEASDIRFNPPLYEQRYQEMVRISRLYQPKKVIDIGCGELKVVQLLKHQESLHELIGLDIDGDLLKQRKYAIQPPLGEYLQPRSHPFTITLLCGSITERDTRLLNSDLVICVEVIEHLYPDDVAKATKVIFGYMRPPVAAFTTPNSEFNVLFPNLQGFRHYDHKFEWTRKEFQEWGDAICTDYGYTVKYSGLGTGPSGTEHLGFCTQMALFKRITSHEVGEEDQVPGADYVSDVDTYSVVACENYPCKIQHNSPEALLNEVQYHLRKLLEDVRWILDDEAGMYDDASEDGDDEVAFWKARSRQTCPKQDSVVGEVDGERGGGCCLSSDQRVKLQDLKSDKVVTISRHQEESLETLLLQKCHLDDQRHVEGPKAISDSDCRRKISYGRHHCDGLVKFDHRCDSLLLTVEGICCMPRKELTQGGQRLTSREGKELNSSMVDAIFPCAMESNGGEASMLDCTVDNYTPVYTAGSRTEFCTNGRTFPSDDANTEDGFYDQWERGFPKTSINDSDDITVSIPLERLMVFTDVQEKCSDINNLRAVLSHSSLFNLTEDGTAIVCPVYEQESEKFRFCETDEDDDDDDDDDDEDSKREENIDSLDWNMEVGEESEMESWD